MLHSPLGIGIVGAGNIIKSHASALGQWPGLARLVAVADVDEERAKKAKSRFGFKTAYDDYRRLLDDENVEVVQVCTPPNKHARIVVDALAAGKHVLCEKPMAATLSDADAIVHAARQRPEQKTSFVFQLRLNPALVCMKRAIEHPSTGSVLSAAMRVRIRKRPNYYLSSPGRGSWDVDGGGVLINQAIHQLDALIWLLGRCSEASAVIDRFVQPCEAEDTLAGWVKFDGGEFATVDCTTCAQRRNFAIEVQCEHACLRVSGDPDSSKFRWEYESADRKVRQSLREVRQDVKLASAPGQSSWTFSKPSGHAALIHQFLMAVRSEATCPVPPREARRSLELAAALYQSGLTNQVVALPLGSKSPVYGGVRAEMATSLDWTLPPPDKDTRQDPLHGGAMMNQGKPAIKVRGRTVWMPYPPPWTRLKRAASLTFDAMTMIPRIAKGKTTIGDGSRIVNNFERAFRRLTGSKYALAMNNGTATLHSAYFAVGVGPGTEVIVPAYTWHASATPVLQCGATPVFCDIDPRTLTADPDDIERRITERTRAICVVHVWGNPAEMDRICEIASRHDISVVEDCSHAHGAFYQGKPVGTWGDVGCFSLNSGKAVDAGEGGIAVTDDPRLFDRMLVLGHFGRIQKGQAAKTFDFGDMSLGQKYRPHQCAMYLAMGSLRRLATLNKRCDRSWQTLCDALQDVPGIRTFETLEHAHRGGYQAFVLAYEGAELGGPDRDTFVKAVKRQGVPITADRYSQINYTYGALHQAPLFTSVHRPGLGGGCYDPTRPWEEVVRSESLPGCERLSRQLVSLPRLDAASRGYVRSCAKAIKKVLKAYGVRAEATPEAPPAPSADEKQPLTTGAGA
ncbi:MAG: aminotransferase class I/II-fold pyridoxal phosphate-dependent enzyme [Phycisphaerae bacterium]|jgi:dTDP-4-amino-4,6-dideoxygalactose transaminase/predicted dehydrogenase